MRRSAWTSLVGVAAALLATADSSGGSRSAPSAHHDGVSSVAFSPDGAILASVGDRTIRLWDARTGRPLRTIRAHARWARGAWFQPDGTLLSTGVGARRDTTRERWEARRWDPDTGRQLSSFPLMVPPYATSADGALLATSDREAEGDDRSTAILLVETALGRREARLDVGLDPLLMAFSPEGYLAVYGTHGRGCPSGVVLDCDQIQVRDLASGQVRHVIDVPDSDLLALAYSPDGTLLAAGHGGHPSGALSVWDTSTGALRRHWRSDPARVHAVAFSAEGRRLFSGARFGHVTAWPLDGNVGRMRFPRVSGSVADLTLSPDGRLLAQADGHWMTSRVLVWDAGSGQLLWER